ncbi:hypothetical protein OIDMADRAFT_122620 [Oidiodendron maius Zn]|uniref:Uncharacterized protein n=1 Tax=Oidiodendron maius (strain Zn) TaxID=913774 RepID=A0A0C3HFU8_OIDMZ|nr:hypothetical protein OIDMADRAFT_122620 [Oidiodendron maius Zn]
MPATLDTPVLTVDVGLIHKVDTRNVENLFSMWTVFSRCAGSLEEGRRLENLSWRLWNRETFCCDPISEANATTPATSVSARTSEGRYTAEVPDLSSSPGSVADEEAIEFDHQHHHSTSNPLDISRPQIRRQDSASSRSRGRERHITPDDLEKMVSTIKEKKDLKPLNLSISPLPTVAEKPQSEPQEAPAPAPTPKTPIIENAVASTSAQTVSSGSMSGTSERSTTSVVRGFSPAHVSSSYRTKPLLSAPSSIPTADIAAAENPKAAAMKKSGNPVFTFGGSSNEDEASLPSRSQPRSALTESIQRPPKKQTSFREEVATRTIQEEQPFDDDVFESDDDDDIDESAIDDDEDSSDWEDSNDSGNASIDEKTFFQRVDSRPNLTSRRSLITTMLHQNDRANALLATAASKSTPVLKRSPRASPNGPSLAASLESDDGSALMMKSGGLKPIAENPRFGGARTPAQPIARATTIPHQLALSPRTTRRNMLATELTVSLRQNLLWERQQKSQTANAVLKRRHTAHDMADLKQYPEKVHMDKDDKDANASWNEYFSSGLGEYHSKGW